MEKLGQNKPLSAGLEALLLSHSCGEDIGLLSASFFLLTPLGGSPIHPKMLAMILGL